MQVPEMKPLYRGVLKGNHAIQTVSQAERQMEREIERERVCVWEGHDIHRLPDEFLRSTSLVLVEVLVPWTTQKI